LSDWLLGADRRAETAVNHRFNNYRTPFRQSHGAMKLPRHATTPALMTASIGI
jgi:hypothetical protein